MESNTLQRLDEHCFGMEQRILFLEEQLRMAEQETIALVNSQIKHNGAMMFNLLEATLKGVTHETN